MISPTNLELVVPERGFVSVKIYNLLGQTVATLAKGIMDANANGHKLSWNASEMSSGVYFVRAEAAGEVQTQKLMFIK